MPFAMVSGKRLHYQTLGTGFPLLLGHSYLWDSSMWAPQIEVLSQEYQVIVPDLWGHGQSESLPERSGTLNQLAAQMSEFLDALVVDECAVIGLSVGGMWGAELALNEPGRVAALVLMDTYLGAEPEATRSQYFSMLDAIEAIGAVPQPLLNAIVPLFFSSNIATDSELVFSFRRALAGFSAAQLRESVVPLGRMIFGRADTMSELQALDPKRTLLMCGAQDQARVPLETVKMAEVIGCEYLIVPDAGHISNLENAPFVTNALVEWLKQRGF
jgi:pimeloyl-ACP methyl ester carboxylesterase